MILSVPLLMALGTAFADESDDGGLPVTLTEEFKLRYWVSDERLPTHPDRAVFNYVEQVNRLSATGTWGDWTATAQVDEVALFANQYILDDVLYAERELVDPDVFSPMPGFSYLNPEKLSLRYETATLGITAGDFYAAFGRGAALNVARNVDIDVDTSIQGLKAVWRPGAWDLTALVGQLNRQQVLMTEPNLAVRGDYRHLVAGLRAERFGLGPANVGVHGVLWNFVEDPGWPTDYGEDGATPDALVGGATLELLGVGGLDWFVEADTYAYPTSTLCAGDDPQQGYALYGSAAAYVGDTVWLVEGKRYLRAEHLNAVVGGERYEVAIAPTLEYERATTEDSDAALNSDDLYGGRIRMDWSAARGVVPYASVALFRDREHRDDDGEHFNRAPETIVHPMVGLELTVDHWAVLVNAGYRVDDRDGDDYGTDRQLHGDLDFKFPLGHGFLGNVSSAVEWFRWGDNLFQQADYLETENAFSVQKGSDIALIAYLDFTDNPLVDTTGNLSDPLYGALELQVKPTTAMTVKAFYGAYKAGIRCSGGQCRQVPGFEGARVTLLGTF